MTGFENTLFGLAWVFINGVRSSGTTIGRVPTTGGTRHTEIGTGFSDVPLQPQTKLFDVRIFPNMVLNPADIRATMDPRKIVAGCMARYFVNWRPGASALLLDEAAGVTHSGSPHNLTLASDARAVALCEEPPWREVIGVR
jgi:hypothetical protein